MTEYNKKKTSKMARQKINQSYTKYRQLLDDRMLELKPSKYKAGTFSRLVGDRPMDGEILHSDLKARRKLAHLVQKEIASLRAANPRLRFFHATLLSDDGVISDRSPYLALDSLRGKADKSIRALDCHGISVVEIQALTNWPQKGEGRTLLAHVHALIWYDPAVQRRDVSKFRGIEMDLERSRRWSCAFGAPAVRVLEITEQLGCPSYWAYYIFKAPYDAKRLVNCSDDGRGLLTRKFEPTLKGYRPELAFRIFELTSRVPITQMSRGVSDGANIMRRCRARLSHWHEKRDTCPQIRKTRMRQLFAWTQRFRRAKYRKCYINGKMI